MFSLKLPSLNYRKYGIKFHQCLFAVLQWCQQHQYFGLNQEALSKCHVQIMHNTLFYKNSIVATTVVINRHQNTSWEHNSDKSDWEWA